MRDALLVAGREFRQVLATRGFWVTLLIVPFALAVSIFASAAFAPQTAVAFTVVDASGHYAAPIRQRLELNYQREVLRNLETYVQRWKLASVDPHAMWAVQGAWASNYAVEKFIADGGSGAALRRLQPHIPVDAPPFKLPTRYWTEVPPPSGVPTGQGPEAFGHAIAGPLQGDVDTPFGKRALALAVYIPADFGAGRTPVRLWTNGRYDGGLSNDIREALTAQLRLQVLQASGLPPEAAARIETLQAPVQVTEPPVGGGRGVVVARSIVPLALVYLLLITAMTTGSMMLQGLIEERSNRLLESVLACIRPGALMYGKLMGLGAVGLCIVSVWAGCAVGAAMFAQGAVSDLLRPSLEALDQPWMIGALIFYFLSGYLIVSMVFLAIGSVSDSMQDAQGFLTPVLLAVMLPVMFLIQATLRSPDSLFPHVLSWIPFYTPFAMLARLGSGVPLPELLGTGALLIAFIVLELVLLGRVFRASLLSAGQPASPAVFARLMFQRGEG
jgi:ABC-2 type transport system permease protein